jgi:hypothetical protein
MPYNTDFYITGTLPADAPGAFFASSGDWIEKLFPAQD